MVISIVREALPTSLFTLCHVLWGKIYFKVVFLNFCTIPGHILYLATLGH